LVCLRFFSNRDGLFVNLSTKVRPAWRRVFRIHKKFERDATARPFRKKTFFNNDQHKERIILTLFSRDRPRRNLLFI